MMLFEQSPYLSLKERIALTEEFIQVLDLLGFYREMLERYQGLLELVKEGTEGEVSKKSVEVLMNIAQTHLRLKEYNETLACYQQALNAVETEDLEEMKGDVLLQLGMSHWFNYDMYEAKKCLYKAIENRRENGLLKNADVGQAYYYLGRIYYAQWDYDESHECLKKALRILRRHFDEEHEDVVEVMRYLDKVKQKRSDE